MRDTEKNENFQMGCCTLQLQLSQRHICSTLTLYCMNYFTILASKCTWPGGWSMQ